MKTLAAVLRHEREPQPYAVSKPLALEEVDLAEPGPHELLVRIEAAGVCHSDLSVINGHRPRPLPMALGHEAAGVVAAVGPDVRDVREGDHVVLVFMPSCGRCPACARRQPTLCAAAAKANSAGSLLSGGRRITDAIGGSLHHHLGVSGFAQHAVVDRSSAVVVDRDLPMDIAALFGCAMLTGFGAVRNTAAVAPGESVAVIGLGGVGLAAVLGAKAAQAAPVIAIDPVPAKRELALQLGATHAAAPQDAAAVVADATGGLGVRWAFEAAGKAAVMRQAFELAGRGGAAVFIGLPPSTEELALPAVSFVGESKSAIGSYMGSADPQQDVPALIGLWRDGALPVEKLKSHTLALADLNEAMDRLADGSAVRQVILPHGRGA
ncbi:Alcohol dehydrogenase GroES domain protein [Segniliparus rotundus DSM 44985]|uniref:Alcohol dehydrogenase GroES domain protein n=1 Tax=Segniliparus rotundus (strain ATCC BAA-972 / CDC 1076 / CIP 108378 / DSM 44985 / JCM 13578) TaxID=640132 RepID=D6ZBY2_SEGRD|nr:alcohol dehydrogenase catalytic domain-containing protein [Segniliparus rotundus]ADG96959.1 Alcohol dehydrogenase GroES domain protein [Segniliparus rotundus DSM 44985]